MHAAPETKVKITIYKDVSTNQTIQVAFKRDFIKVKYLTGKSWVKYRLIGAGVFDDFRGSRIYLKGRDKLVWRSRKYGEQITFRRHRDANNPYYHQGKNSNRSNISTSTLEGVWYEPKAGKELILIDNRSGIKLKFRGSSDWFNFEKRENGIFVDKNGNSYTIMDGSRLLWQDHAGRRSYILEKRTDSIDWDQ